MKASAIALGLLFGWAMLGWSGWWLAVWLVLCLAWAITGSDAGEGSVKR